MDKVKLHSCQTRQVFHEIVLKKWLRYSKKLVVSSEDTKALVEETNEVLGLTKCDCGVENADGSTGRLSD